MHTFDQLGIPAGTAICYSGFRAGQQPGGKYPSYDEIKEDLLLLQGRWKYLRLYDCDLHGETVLDVIKREGLDFKIMLGAYITAEMNNYNCPWEGGVYSEEVLAQNRTINRQRVDHLALLANQYADIVFSLSVGNEACVDWTDHYVSPASVVHYAQLVKKACKQPVTFCENYVPWLINLQELAEALDFISIHSYPVWEYKHISESLEYTKANYRAVAEKYPHKPVVITEAGWATQSNGRGIPPHHVSEAYQKQYLQELTEWTTQENILCFFFEAFDEPWKGSPEPLEPEKHWGVYFSDRSPKMAMQP